MKSRPPTVLWFGNMSRRMERYSAWRGEGRFFQTSSKFWARTYGKFVQGAQDARTAQPRRSRNATLTVEQPELVVHSAGHTRAYAGHAYVPGMIPQGVDTQEIR